MASIASTSYTIYNFYFSYFSGRKRIVIKATEYREENWEKE
jgi:hypothetical protein